MTIKRKSGRQEVVSAILDFNFADANGTNFNPLAELPGDGIVVSGHLLVESAGDAGLTANLGDSVSGNRYGNAVAMDAAGATALGITGYEYTTIDNLGITFSAQPTQGSGRIVVNYVVSGRAGFSQGLDDK